MLNSPQSQGPTKSEADMKHLSKKLQIEQGVVVMRLLLFLTLNNKNKSNLGLGMAKIFLMFQSLKFS